MKRLFYILLLINFIGFAQEYNLYPLEDSNFLAYLQENYPATIVNDSLDINATGDIQSIYIDYDWIFYAYDSTINNLDGIQFFNNLESLVITGCDLTTPPNLPDNLVELQISGSSFTSMPVFPESLHILNISSTPINDFLTLPENLVELSLYGSEITNLPSLPENLVEIRISAEQLTSLPDLPNNLMILEIENSPITNLPSLPENLIRLKVVGSNLINLPDLPNSLQELDVNNNQLTSLPVLPNSLYQIYISNNQLTSLPEIMLWVDELYFDGNPIECVTNYLYQHNETYQFPLCEVNFGCTNALACNYDPDANNEDSSCYFAETNYDCDGACLNDSDADGICNEHEVLGCTDPFAFNYNPNATDNDNSCGYIIYGCTNTNACNYDPDATNEDGSCVFAQMYYNCDGNCINDTDQDEVCDEEDNCLEVVNPDQEDTDNDGEGDSCDYDDGIGINEISEDTPKLIKMIDLLGREQKEHKRGTLLFYIYDNGIVEKKFNP